MLKIGIIGYGYWGPNLLRNFISSGLCTVHTVVDSRKDRIELIKRSYPTIECLTDASEVLYNKEIDAVVIATPVFSHYPLAKAALENGKHVLLEKPMTSSVN
jgi:predicted dehydrogenase